MGVTSDRRDPEPRAPGRRGPDRRVPGHRDPGRRAPVRRGPDRRVPGQFVRIRLLQHQHRLPRHRVRSRSRRLDAGSGARTEYRAPLWSRSRWAGESAAVANTTDFTQRLGLRVGALLRSGSARHSGPMGTRIPDQRQNTQSVAKVLTSLVPPPASSSLVKQLSGVQGSAVAKTPLVLPLRDVMTSPNCKSAALPCRRFISTYADKFSHLRGDDLS
jgi:hypothetical protein